MSKDNYIRGFEKVATSQGYDPEALARFALTTKLQKQAFLGVLPKVFKGVSQVASKAAPLARKATPFVTKARNGVKGVANHVISTLKDPKTYLIGGGGAGFLGGEYLLEKKLPPKFKDFLRRAYPGGKPATQPQSPALTTSQPEAL